MGEDPTTGALLSHSWMLRYSQGRDYQEFYMEINVEKEFIHYSVLLHTKLLRTPLLVSGKIFFLKLNKKKKTSSFHSPLFAVQVLTNYLERFLRHRCFFCFRNRVIDKKLPFLQLESNLEGFFSRVSFRDQSGKDGSTNVRTGMKADRIMGKLQIHHHDKVKMPGVDIIINTAILLIKSGRLILKAAKV